MLKVNVGTGDRVFRVVMGVALGFIGFFENPVVSGGLSQTLMAVGGVVLAVTAIIRFCPIYAVAGLSTCALEEAPAE